MEVRNEALRYTRAKTNDHDRRPLLRHMTNPLQTFRVLFGHGIQTWEGLRSTDELVPLNNSVVRFYFDLRTRYIQMP